jgi:hypothetical protein
MLVVCSGTPFSFSLARGHETSVMPGKLGASAPGDLTNQE